MLSKMKKRTSPLNESSTLITIPTEQSDISDNRSFTRISQCSYIEKIRQLEDILNRVKTQQIELLTQNSELQQRFQSKKQLLNHYFNSYQKQSSKEDPQSNQNISLEPCSTLRTYRVSHQNLPTKIHLKPQNPQFYSVFNSPNKEQKKNSTEKQACQRNHLHHARRSTGLIVRQTYKIPRFDEVDLHSLHSEYSTLKKYQKKFQSIQSIWNSQKQRGKVMRPQQRFSVNSYL